MTKPSDIAFTESVKAIQARKGSRNGYERMSPEVAFHTRITNELAAFVATQDSVFLSTANLTGQPYIQHRGGPPGFLKVIDENTLAFADFKGNRQYISQGNLIDNPKAFLFLIDYRQRARIKIWGEAKVIENDDELLQSLMPPREEYRAAPEQVIQFRVQVWDGNCPQHIPERMDIAAVEKAISERDEEIAKLKRQLSAQADASNTPPGERR